MGCFNVNESESNKSQIIYVDNVRRKKSFSILVTDNRNKNDNIQNISKHIQTFEQNLDSGEENGVFITDLDGNHLAVTELGANFVDRENLNEEREGTEIRTSTAYKWVVFITVCFVQSVPVGFAFSFGALFPTILEEYQEGRASTAAVQSIFNGVGLSSAILTGVLAQRYGPRKCGVCGAVLFSAGLLISSFATSTVYLQLSYGVVTALGFSSLYVSGNQILSQLFTGQTRVVCLSIASVATGVAGILYPYFLDWLTSTFGLNGTILLIGGVTLNLIPLAFLWHAPIKRLTVEHPRETTAKGTKSCHKFPGWNLAKLIYKTLRYKPFLFVFLGLGLAVSVINDFQSLGLDIILSNGLSMNQGLNGIIVSSAASIPARIITGLINRIKGYNSIMTPILATITGACGMLILLFDSTYIGNVLAGGLIGIARGFCIASMSVVTISILDASTFSTGLGLIIGLNGIITTGTGPLYGLLRDINGSYTIPLCVTTTVLSAGCLFCIVSLVLHSQDKRKENRDRVMSVYTVTRF